MYIMVLNKDGSRAKSQRGAQFSGGAYIASPGSGNLAIARHRLHCFNVLLN